jgi:hypothetical protein
MNKSPGRFTLAAGIYIASAIYLYSPYFSKFGCLDFLLIANVWLGASGCYLLSRRWTSCLSGSLIAGAIYGAGPFLLGLANFHPTGGLLAAAVPWLFCPAAFIPRIKGKWLCWPLSMLPFLAIFLFFQIATRLHLFAIPLNIKLHLIDLVSVSFPLIGAKRGMIPFGFYHIPIAALITGLYMLVKARRFGVMIILCTGTLLGFCSSFYNISPIIWLSIPSLCFSIIIGVGVQALISASYTDRKWILTVTVILMILAIISLLMATKYFQTFLSAGSEYGRLFVRSARMYILGIITVGIIFFSTRAKLRILWLRITILSLSLGTDIFLGATFITDIYH